MFCIHVHTGSDSTLHCFVSAYLNLLRTNPTVFEGLAPKFFVLPSASDKKNHISSLIARSDSWYNRHVHNPFRFCPFVIPFVKIEDDTAAAGT